MFPSYPILLGFSVHERGSRSVLWGFCIMSGLTLSVLYILMLILLLKVSYRGPLLYSYVIQNLSWQMGFWFATIPLGLCVLLVFFFVPEVRLRIRPSLWFDWSLRQTTYIRVNQEGLTLDTTDPEKGNLKDKSPSSLEKPKPSPKTYVSQLKIWNGTYSQSNILKIFLRPFPFLLSPVVGHLPPLKF